jgi:hypothetical protein
MSRKMAGNVEWKHPACEQGQVCTLQAAEEEYFQYP